MSELSDYKRTVFDPLEASLRKTIATQAERIKELEIERDEAIKDRNAHAEHVLRVAAEAKDGLAALEEIDACWDAYGTAVNRMNLTLSEQIASTLRELDDALRDYGNAESECKAAEARVGELEAALATPPAAPSMPAGDVSSLIAARCSALPGKLIDCPVCGAVDKERDRQEADVAALVKAAFEAAQTMPTLDAEDRCAKEDLYSALKPFAPFADRVAREEDKADA